MSVSDRKPLWRRWWRTGARRRLILLLAAPMLLFLTVPLLALLIKAPPRILVRYLGDSATTQAIALSLSTCTAATVLVVVLGTPISYILARWRFPGRSALEVLVDLPTVLPPAAAGLALLMVFGRSGLLGGWLDFLGIRIAFTPLAVVLAQAFVASPYYIRTASEGLAAVREDFEKAAAVDGATPIQVFRYISFPLAWRSFLGGAVLTWGRALGEFGATIIFAGNYPGRTQTMPLAVYIGFEIDFNEALTLAVILLVLSFGILIAMRTILRGAAPDRS